MTLPQPTSSYLNDVYLGAGTAELVPEVLSERGVHRPLVVTDANLRREGLVDALELDDPAVFDDVQTNPDADMVRVGATAYDAHDCDGIVALGGGSPIDVAKGIGIAHAHDAPPEAYAVGTDRHLEAPLPELVAVPTTAGSGSEVGRAALIVTPAGEKTAIIDPSLIPSVAVCDPELTTSLPPRLTAATGMDAISHCVETYCSSRVNPTADALALDGFERAYNAIREAVAKGDDLDARREMMIAALHGGLTFQKGLGAVHSLSHPLGGLDDRTLHHGTLNGIFLPHVLRFNEPSIPDELRALEEVIGIDDGTPLSTVMAELLDSLPLPTRLSELDVDRDDIDAVVEPALNDHCSETNPRPLDREDIRSLYEAAL